MVFAIFGAMAPGGGVLGATIVSRRCLRSFCGGLGGESGWFWWGWLFLKMGGLINMLG